jgi:hypothetical protein
MPDARLRDLKKQRAETEFSKDGGQPRLCRAESSPLDSRKPTTSVPRL